MKGIKIVKEKEVKNKLQELISVQTFHQELIRSQGLGK